MFRISSKLLTRSSCKPSFLHSSLYFSSEALLIRSSTHEEINSEYIAPIKKSMSVKFEDNLFIRERSYDRLKKASVSEDNENSEESQHEEELVNNEGARNELEDENGKKDLGSKTSPDTVKTYEEISNEYNALKMRGNIQLQEYYDIIDSFCRVDEVLSAVNVIIDIKSAKMTPTALMFSRIFEFGLRFLPLREIAVLFLDFHDSFFTGKGAESFKLNHSQNYDVFQMLVSMMKEDNIILPIHFYERLMKILGRSHRIDYMRVLLEKVDSLGIKPSAYLYNHLLLALSNDSKHFSNVKTLYETLKVNGMANQTSRVSLLISLVHSKHDTQLKEFLNEIHSTSENDVRIYYPHVFKAMIQCNRAAEALKLANDLYAMQDVKLNYFTFEPLFHHAIHKNDFNLFMKLKGMCDSKNVKMTINGYCLYAEIGAKSNIMKIRDVIEECLRVHGRINIVIYNLFLKLLADSSTLFENKFFLMNVIHSIPSAKFDPEGPFKDHPYGFFTQFSSKLHQNVRAILNKILADGLQYNGVTIEFVALNLFRDRDFETITKMYSVCCQMKRIFPTTNFVKTVLNVAISTENFPLLNETLKKLFATGSTLSPFDVIKIGQLERKYPQWKIFKMPNRMLPSIDQINAAKELYAKRSQYKGSRFSSMV